jgi:hypothetical protein
LGGIRVGYVQAAFDLPAGDPSGPPAERFRHPTKAFDDAALAVLRGRLGVRLRPVTLPDAPWDAMRVILTAEAAAAFDGLTRSERDRELVQQGPGDWANTFRTARFVPAVDYINANRHRTLAMQAWARLFEGPEAVDVIVTPTSAAGLSQLVATNFTGHPAVIVPHGFREDGTPVSLTFLGRCTARRRCCGWAAAYQGATVSPRAGGSSVVCMRAGRGASREAQRAMLRGSTRRVRVPPHAMHTAALSCVHTVRHRWRVGAMRTTMGTRVALPFVFISRAGWLLLQTDLKVPLERGT